MASNVDRGDDDVRRVIVTLDTDAEAEAGEVERLGQQLRAELRQLDVESVNYAIGDVPAGAKGDPSIWTELLITISSAGGVLPTLLHTIQGWLARHRKAHRIAVTIDGDTIELDGASSEERRKLINAYISRHR